MKVTVSYYSDNILFLLMYKYSLAAKYLDDCVVRNITFYWVREITNIHN